MDISHKENYGGKLGDVRLDKRANQLSAMLYFGRSSSIHEMASTESGQKAAYRFFSNDKVEESKLISVAKEKSGFLCAGKDVLVVQDSSEINMDNHRNRLKRGKGIGLTGNNEDLGFFLHGSLVLDEATETLLGYSDIQLWHREQDKEDKEERRYKNLPIEEKESYKWIKACNESKAHLSQARTLTFIEDREGDIYEQFATVPDERTHLIIRSRDNRRLAEGSKLFDKLSEQSKAGQYEIEIVGDIRKGVESRTAIVEVRYCQVAIARPRDLKKAGLKESVSLSAIEVKEVNVPDGVKAVHWRILTTHSVTSYEQAIDIVKKISVTMVYRTDVSIIKEKRVPDRIERIRNRLGYSQINSDDPNGSITSDAVTVSL